MRQEEMWQEFLNSKNTDSLEYSAWQFGDDADLLSNLVLNGEKTATCSLLKFYEIENEKLPEINEYSLILDSKNEAVCIIKTTEIKIVKFNEVGEELASKEGEGDKSLSYWKKVHKNFFEKELKKIGLEFNEDLKLVFEEFEVVYK